MNVQLYNILNRAYEFILKDEQEYRPQIESHSRLLKRYENSLNYEPRFNKIPFPWIWLLLSLFLFPIAPLVILIIYAINNLKLFVSYKREKAKFDPVAHRNKTLQNVESERKILEDLKKRQTEHYNSCKECISFIPEHLRKVRSIEAMRHYVKIGRAYTLDQAWEYWAQDLREMDEMERQAEEREERRRQHRETQDSLNTIARNQEKIRDELEATRRDMQERRWY